MTAKTSCQRLELFSSGLKRRKFRLLRFNFIVSRKKAPITRVASALYLPGRGTLTA